MAATTQVKAGSAFVELTAKNEMLMKGLNAAAKRLNSFGNGVQSVGMKMLAIGTVAATPLVAGLTAFTNFDDAIRTVKGATQATETEFQALRDKAKQLGATTSYTATQVANLMTELGRAGFKPDQIIAMTGSVMDLARATGTDATLASGIFAATIRQFGLEATDSARIVDSLTAAANMSFNSVESLGEALSYAGPVAADANMSLEETLAILGTLGNVGIQGSMAGTAIRRLLILSAADAAAFQEEFGVATKDAQGNARSLVDILGEVSAATANMGNADRAEKFAKVFGLLGITAGSAIGKTAADTRKLLADIQASQGIAAKTAQEMDAGMGGAWRIMLSALEGVAIEFGDAVSGPLSAAMDTISQYLSLAGEWIKANRDTVVVLGGLLLSGIALGAGLIALGVGIKIVALAASGLAIALGIGSAILGAMLSPIGLVTILLAELAAWFLLTSDVGSQALAWLSASFTQLKNDFLISWGVIVKALASGDFALAGRLAFSLLKMEFASVVGWLTNRWLEFKYAFTSIAAEASFGIARLFTDGMAGIETGWVESIAFLSDAWAIFTNVLTQTWYSTVGFIQKAWLQLKSLFDDTVNVEAETTRINNEIAGKQQAANQGMLDGVAARDQQRQQRRGQIEQGRVGAQAELDRMQAAEKAAQDAKLGGDLAAAQGEVNAARAAWQAAVQKAAKDQAAGAKPGDPAADPFASGSITSSLGNTGAALASVRDGLEGKGTFNAFAAQGLGSDSLAERAAKAAEQTADNTDELIRKADKGKLVFK
jgi:TP901 family phage tail tape measure protein